MTGYRTIGGLAFKFPDLESARVANVDLMLVAAETFASALAPKLDGGKKFRFLYVSGSMAETDMGKKLWMMQDSRRFKVRVHASVILLHSSFFSRWASV